MIAPNKITFYCKPADISGVHHAFPVDSSASHDSARYWATGQYSWQIDQKDPITFEWNNGGFDHVTIESLDIRGEGGRAYQVIVKRDGHFFKVDLREATLMEVILGHGIQAGGRLNGSFCFAKEGSQTKLILEGSDTHKEALAERMKREKYTKKISNKDLKPGHVYSTISGKSKLFLGCVYSANIDEYSGNISKVYKGVLLADWDKWNKDYIKKFLETGELVEGNRVYSGNFDVVKSHSFKIEGEKVADVDLEPLVKRLNDLGMNEYEEKMGKDRHSNYLWGYTGSYELAKMRTNRKEVDFKPADITAMKQHRDRFYNRRFF
ncbi:hypothetical protein CPT_Moonbeam157 [Bacillus phage Moonbeam]|uniref:Uncharacterized protein n=1 Tax=Bacillus phage Moonbeam TaxID=1540091 RepID=A0A0A0RN92_9CAUD|nr:hypothetical protein CPT_Moonbeam157 [Bacillus phage Moonbeam]AIW03555.1 hypothetical protein CPT_Moonbeam157 [Bacillus phage Moonbeam]